MLMRKGQRRIRLHCDQCAMIVEGDFAHQNGKSVGRCAWVDKIDRIDAGATGIQFAHNFNNSIKITAGIIITQYIDRHILG